MKKLLKFISLTFVFGLLVSCTNYENSGTTVSFTFNPSDFFKDSGARDVPVSNTGKYLVASLMGDYSDTKIIPVSEAVGSQTVEFTSVPVGAEVSVMAYVYTHTSFPMKHFGKSAAKKIVSGPNPVKLVMESLLDVDYSSTNEALSTIYISCGTFNDKLIRSDSDITFSISFYSNGVYTIQQGTGVISTGFYSEINDNICFIECVYSPVEFSYNPSSDDIPYEHYFISSDYNDIIITSPKIWVMKKPVFNDSSITDSSCFIKSKNGIVYTFENSGV